MARKGDCKPKQNLIGKRYDKLVVESYAGYRLGKTGEVYHLWKCKCDCGGEKIATGAGLNSGHCRSCGCISHAPKTMPWVKHHMADTKLYNIWKSMKGRCYTPSCKGYKYYGGRGIKVCDEWKNDFKVFYEWAVSHGYDENAERGKCSLDRIDVNGNYEPNNCRIVGNLTQANNKSDTVYRDLDGMKVTTREAAIMRGVSYKKLRSRINRGYTLEEAVNKDFSNTHVYITYKKQTHSIPEWSNITGIKKVTLYARYRKGYTPEEIFEKPIRKCNRWDK